MTDRKLLDKARGKMLKAAHEQLLEITGRTVLGASGRKPLDVAHLENCWLWHTKKIYFENWRVRQVEN